MNIDRFKRPVVVLVGLGFPIEIRSVTEAYRYLMESAASSRDPARSIALKACHAALRGEVEVETVRGLFAAFAQKHDILAPDGNVIAAFRSRRDRDPHVN